jgi:xylan 1,4-beta-xylosidase
MKTLIPLVTFVASALCADTAMFQNPILPGSHPDPSICRVGDDFYMVNSTFELYPGLPIHHSKDLVNWKLIGYGLHRKEQCTGKVNLVDVQSDGGIHAPTIRYHKGLFYIITTNVYLPPEEGAQTEFVNFIITAENPAGPWSDPHVLEGAPGIDPDIFFDEDGKVWYVGTHSPENPSFPGEGEIWLQEIDLEKWELTGERSYLWRGACGGVWVEGPHIYKHDGRYYLLVAEGGTSFNHAVMIAVAENIRGPYTSNDRNPILTTRHITYDHWVHSTGHADLVQLEDGRWYMVCLGVRGDEQRNSNMGRESHLLPVQWEREPFEWKEVRYEWPVCSPVTGRVERTFALPFKGHHQKRELTYKNDFEGGDLGLEWNYRRVPTRDFVSIVDGDLSISSSPNSLEERGNYHWVGFRQRHSDFNLVAKMAFEPQIEDSEAGLSIVQKDNNYLNFTVLRSEGKSELMLKGVSPQKGQIAQSVTLENYEGTILLNIVSANHRYTFSYSIDGGNSFVKCFETSADWVLSRGYTGAFFGFYASSNGFPTSDVAKFGWVDVSYSE